MNKVDRRAATMAATFTQLHLIPDFNPKYLEDSLTSLPGYHMARDMTYEQVFWNDNVTLEEAYAFSVKLQRSLPYFKMLPEFNDATEVIVRRSTDLSRIPLPQFYLIKLGEHWKQIDRAVRMQVIFDKILAVFGTQEEAQKYYFDRVRSEPEYRNLKEVSFEDVFKQPNVSIGAALAVFEAIPEIPVRLREYELYYRLYLNVAVGTPIPTQDTLRARLDINRLCLTRRITGNEKRQPLIPPFLQTLPITGEGRATTGSSTTTTTGGKEKRSDSSHLSSEITSRFKLQDASPQSHNVRAQPRASNLVGGELEVGNAKEIAPTVMAISDGHKFYAIDEWHMIPLFGKIIAECKKLDANAMQDASPQSHSVRAEPRASNLVRDELGVGNAKEKGKIVVAISDDHKFYAIDEWHMIHRFGKILAEQKKLDANAMQDTSSHNHSVRAQPRGSNLVGDELGVGNAKEKGKEIAPTVMAVSDGDDGDDDDDDDDDGDVGYHGSSPHISRESHGNGDGGYDYYDIGEWNMTPAFGENMAGQKKISENATLDRPKGLEGVIPRHAFYPLAVPAVRPSPPSEGLLFGRLRAASELARAGNDPPITNSRVSAFSAPLRNTVEGSPIRKPSPSTSVRGSSGNMNSDDGDVSLPKEKTRTKGLFANKEFKDSYLEGIKTIIFPGEVSGRNSLAHRAAMYNNERKFDHSLLFHVICGDKCYMGSKLRVIPNSKRIMTRLKKNLKALEIPYQVIDWTENIPPGLEALKKLLDLLPEKTRLDKKREYKAKLESLASNFGILQLSLEDTVKLDSKLKESHR